MNEKKASSKMTDLMALMVFAVFAVCVLAVLLMGADTYSRLSRRDAAGYAQRTAVQYIATRVRQADTAGGITVEDFGGESALVLREEVNGRAYLTRIYCHEGFIRELFTAEAGEFSPGDGEQVLEAEALHFALDSGTLSVRLLFSDGTAQELTLHLRSKEAAA